LHAHQYTPFFYAAMSRRLRAQPPVLFTEHGRHYPDFRRPKRVFANRFLLRQNDYVTAVGQFVKQAVIDNEGIAAQRIEVVHNGIAPQEFACPPDAARAEVRAELGLPAETPLVLQVARFHPVKDHATALRAFAKVVQDAAALPSPDSRSPAALPVLLLAGDGDARPAAQTLAEQLKLGDRVRFLGVRQDVARLMAAADVFLLSSLSEGISVTLIEAMATALPIVATDVGGNGEVVRHGQTGLLSPRGEPAPLADNLLQLLRDSDMRQRFGQAGRRRMLAQFQQEQMHARYQRIYDKLLALGEESTRQTGEEAT
jgi:glycosyltransferase involved in cell wall biosynthesis